MHDRNNEACDDRRRQNAVGYGDIEERDNRHPDDVEDGNDHADALGAEPVQPTEREFALLIAGEPARAGQEAPPVLLQNLEAAIGPAIALLLVRFEAVWQQPVAITVVRVMGLPAQLEQSEPEVRVLADRVA